MSVMCSVWLARQVSRRGSSSAKTLSAMIFAAAPALDDVVLGRELRVPPALRLDLAAHHDHGVGLEHGGGLLEGAREDDDLARPAQVLDLQECHPLPRRRAPRDHCAHLADRAADLHDEPVEVRTELSDGGVDASEERVADAPQGMVAEVHAEQLALPAQLVVARRGRDGGRSNSS